MSGNVRLAVVGAGLVGRRHVEAIGLCGGVEAAAVGDPAPEARAFAAGLGVPHRASLEEVLARDAPDGVILATPNQLHAEGALACVAAGLPVLVEKPLVPDLASGRELVEAAEAAGVPVLTGHHRRHTPLVAAAKAAIDAGRIGRVVNVHGAAWLMKPDGYFEVEWRSRPGGGPVLINLIHDIDLLAHLCGEIVEVHAFETAVARGNPVEDAAAVILRFRSGAVGTLSVADAVPAPWSWELTARENPAYPPTEESCYWIGGTGGSLELPRLRLWSYPGRRDWMEPIDRIPLPDAGAGDPLVRQVRNFAAVIRGEAGPLVSGRDGLAAVAVIEAIKRSAATGRTETPDIRA